MKFTSLFFLTSFFLVFSGCLSNNESYRQRELRKLEPEEIYARAKAGKLFSPYVIFKDRSGRELSSKQQEQLNKGELYGDQFVDEEGEVVEFVVRKTKKEDEILSMRVQTAIQHRNSPLKYKKVSCDWLKYKLEQTCRKNPDLCMPPAYPGQWIQMPDDVKEEIQAYIYYCGVPSKEKLGEELMYPVEYAFYTYDTQVLSEFYPFLRASATKGDLPAYLLAFIEDFLLTMGGHEQLYGTRLRFRWYPKKESDFTDDYESEPVGIFPVFEPNNLNRRRAAVGLEPIDDYLERFGLEYKQDSIR